MEEYKTKIIKKKSVELEEIEGEKEKRRGGDGEKRKGWDQEDEERGCGPEVNKNKLTHNADLWIENIYMSKNCNDKKISCVVTNKAKT